MQPLRAGRQSLVRKLETVEKQADNERYKKFIVLVGIAASKLVFAGNWSIARHPERRLHGTAGSTANPPSGAENWQKHRRHQNRAKTVFQNCAPTIPEPRNSVAGICTPPPGELSKTAGRLPQNLVPGRRRIHLALTASHSARPAACTCHSGRPAPANAQSRSIQSQPGGLAEAACRESRATPCPATRSHGENLHGNSRTRQCQPPTQSAIPDERATGTLRTG